MSVPKSAVSIALIDSADEGRRLDNVLLSKLKGAPRSLIYKLLRSGQVRVNGGRAKPTYRVTAGDRLRIPPVTIRDADDHSVPASRLAQLAAAIAYEDDDYIVVDKPSGLSCHAGSSQRYGVVEILRALRPEISRLDLGHRLDRETSGCLVLSKHLKALHGFHEALRERRSEKIYQALLRGFPDAAISRIEAPLEISREAGKERRSTVDSQGKPAATELISVAACGPHALVHLRLETGRMHQIRAHAKHIGYPVAGDREYGDPAFNRGLKPLGLKRLFLHSSKIAFESYANPIDVSTPLPEELERVVTQLRERG